MTVQHSSSDDQPLGRDLTAAARCVLFDFDGPLASLFGNHKSHEVARILRGRLDRWGLAPPLTAPDNPLQVLRDTAKFYNGTTSSSRVDELQLVLTEQEVRAARSAVPTDHAFELVAWLVASGKKVAVTTNNSAAAANLYLRRMGLDDFFGAHVHGRLEDPALMKPDPSCLKEALRTTGTGAEDCLMIGDSADDCTAALAAGVTFLGYARNERKRLELKRAGAEHIAESLAHLFDEGPQT